MYEIENGVIGSIFLDQDVLDEIYDIVKPEMFQSRFCRDVYQKALATHSLGRRFDVNTIACELIDEEHDIDSISRKLGNMIMDVPTSTSAIEYSRLIVRDYKSRQMANLLCGTKTNPESIDDEIGTLITRLEELQSSEKQKSRTLAEIVKMNEYSYFDGKPQVTTPQLGFPQLDDCISLEPGDVTVIGARPSVGKSAFANQIVLNVAKQGKKVGLFNLEMVESQVYERMLAKESELDLVRIRKANSFLGNEREKFHQGNRKLEKLNIVISAGSKTDMDIRAECRHQNFDLIVIDYLQLVRSHKRCESRRVEVGEVSRSLKAMAMELNVPVILLSQLSRGVEHTIEREPTMADLRETGDIEQDASVIILLWNLSNKAENKYFKGLKVEKNRQGELMEENIIFHGASMTFFENNKATLSEAKEGLKNLEKKDDRESNIFI